jgi:FAD synthase
MVEAYLLDFEGDLYAEEARVSFVAQVRRDEMRFDSAGELVAQMHRDVEATRVALSGP